MGILLNLEEGSLGTGLKMNRQTLARHIPHTSPTGKPVTFEERIRDILERYGEKHEVSKFIRATLGNFHETIRRVEGMFVTGA